MIEVAGVAVRVLSLDVVAPFVRRVMLVVLSSIHTAMNLVISSSKIVCLILHWCTFGIAVVVINVVGLAYPLHAEEPLAVPIEICNVPISPKPVSVRSGNLRSTTVTFGAIVDVTGCRNQMTWISRIIDLRDEALVNAGSKSNLCPDWRYRLWEKDEHL